MTRTINLSNTQFRYQLIFFVHTYGYIWLPEGCLWHLLPRQNLWWHLLSRQNLPLASFAQAKHVWLYVFAWLHDLPNTMLSAYLKNCDFKKKKRQILPDITTKLFLFGVIRNLQENDYFETLLSFIKLCKNLEKWGPCNFFFFCNCRPENFQLM